MSMRKVLSSAWASVAGGLLLASLAQADAPLSNAPIVSDSEPIICYSDFYPDPEQCNVAAFTFPSGLTGVVRSSVHPFVFGAAVNYQIAVTGGSGSVASLEVPFRCFQAGPARCCNPANRSNKSTH